jgi:hypothetical protein
MEIFYISPGRRKHLLVLLRPIILFFCIFMANSAAANPLQPGTCLNAEEEKLVQLVNQYRVAHGLQQIPVSYSLTTVGQWHVQDLNTNHPDTGTGYQGQSCNMHSWSNWHPALWNAMCYTPDHHEAREMWDKPKQISQGAYQGTGYEIAYFTSGQVTAEAALAGWQGSTPHRDVILEQDIWSGKNWPAMGVGLYLHYAVIWFSETSDTRGMTACQSTGGSAGTTLLIPVLKLLLQ